MKSAAFIFALSICVAACDKSEQVPSPQVNEQVLKAKELVPQVIEPVSQVREQVPSPPEVKPRCAELDDLPADRCESIRPNDSVQTQLERIANCFHFSVMVLHERLVRENPDASYFSRAVSAIEACGRPAPEGLKSLRTQGPGTRVKLVDGSEVHIELFSETNDLLMGGKEEITYVWHLTADGHVEMASTELTWSISGQPW